MHTFDYIVVGGGLAGLYTAYLLSKKGSVGLLAKTSLVDSNSYMAQGGMAAVTDANDTQHAHFLDTLEAGRGLCDEEAVRLLTEEAPDRIAELIELGMKFDLEDGHLALGLEGGHNHKRILHAGGDATGRLVTSFITNLILEEGKVSILEHHTATDLILEGNSCQGLWCYDSQNHLIAPLFASAVVLATGGAAAIYNPTTNPATSVGDGLILAYEQGAELMDLEFIQFHPTALYIRNDSSFLVSEAVRGEGAHLLDRNGERFMLSRHKLAELAPRDVVAREIFYTMQESKMPYVTLSLKHLDPLYIAERFPTITQYCRRKGLDLSGEIPVTPAAHYTVGGIRVDRNGLSSIGQLYAVGEVAATGVMGANRLASNSLIECLVFGKRIADHIHSHVSSAPKTPSLEKPFALASPQKELEIKSKGESMMRTLGTTMMQNVGIVREANPLRKAIGEIEESLQELAVLRDNSFHGRLLYKRHEVALIITKAALLREESRGGHYRKDYPETLPQQKAYHTIINKNSITHQTV
ncbi:MAG: L-aspartate oxidase [Porphyromonas sp.]|nr:L-aspartate oxidase [Porphyromonas sp.]